MATQPPEEMDGVEITQTITPLMTDDEKRVLEVYDRLETLQLEIALLRAQGVLSQEPKQQATDEEIKNAEEAVLKSKAVYQVRNNVIEQTLIANPIVKAVHAGNNASIAEQDLFPLIQRRDELSIKLSGVSTQLSNANTELRKTQRENLVINRENAELAAQMLALAAQANTRRKEDIDDPRLRQQFDELEAEMKASRQKWRIMKATASATIVGSGVDWARDPELLQIVLDKDGDDG